MHLSTFTSFDLSPLLGDEDKITKYALSLLPSSTTESR